MLDIFTGVASKKSQLRTIMSAGLTIDHQRAIISANRDCMWKKGSPADIKRGNYLTWFRPVCRGELIGLDPKLYDAVTQQQEDCGFIGWSRGLQNSVAFMMNGTHVFVTDNHGFAAAYIIAMARFGSIKSGIRLVHLDAHPDNDRSENFETPEYSAITSEQKRIDYMVSRAGISGWIVDPLVKSGIISEKWDWIAMYGESYGWKIKNFGPEQHSRPIKDLNSQVGYNEKVIVDIDLDVLLPLDERLSPGAKFAVGRLHYIPSDIRAKLDELARFAMRGVAVTIATSPCYIVQRRAMVYLRYLLKMMNAAA